jgi:threonyl-tRNA synthetase
MLHSFGFQDYDVLLATRPEKYTGSDEVWEQATAALRSALEELGQPYEEDPGEGVFYGPKIDIKLKDALGRGWQGPTTQVDFNLPQRFEVTYTGEDGQEHTAVMVHRTVLGSMERFLATLVEHYKGAFPVWLAPVQAVIIPIADRHLEYAGQVETELKGAGLRARVDSRSERMNQKIRQAQMEKVPYMLVVGDREAEAGAVSLRLRSGENRGQLPVVDFITEAGQAITGHL